MIIGKFVQLNCIRAELYIYHLILKKHHLNKVGIFGSILHTNEPADIDLLVEEYFNYRDLINLKQELEEAMAKLLMLSSKDMQVQ